MAVTYKAPGKNTIDAVDVAMPTHSEAIQAVLNALVDPQNGVALLDGFHHRRVDFHRFGELLAAVDNPVAHRVDLLHSRTSGNIKLWSPSKYLSILKGERFP